MEFWEKNKKNNKKKLCHLQLKEILCLCVDHCSFRTVCAFTKLELMETNDCFPNLVALEYMRSKQLVQVVGKANNLDFYKCPPKYIRCEQEAERSGYFYIP